MPAPAYAKRDVCKRHRLEPGPVTLDLAPRRARRAAACVAARKPRSSRCWLPASSRHRAAASSIDDYDPRVQSVACKRDRRLSCRTSRFRWTRIDFRRYVDYRAALWNVEPRRAHAHAEVLRERLEGMHEAFAYPLIGALIGNAEIDRARPARSPPTRRRSSRRRGPRASFRRTPTPPRREPFRRAAPASYGATQS